MKRKGRTPPKSQEAANGGNPQECKERGFHFATLSGLRSAQHCRTQESLRDTLQGSRLKRVHVPNPVHSRGSTASPLEAKLAAAWALDAMQSSSLRTCLEGLMRLVRSPKQTHATKQPDHTRTCLMMMSPSQEMGESAEMNKIEVVTDLTLPHLREGKPEEIRCTTSSTKSKHWRTQLKQYRRRRACEQLLHQQRMSMLKTEQDRSREPPKDMQYVAEVISRELGVCIRQEALLPPALLTGHVLGDGNCLWRALKKAGVHQGLCLRSWQQLKRRTMRTLRRTSQAQYHTHLHRYGDWGDTVALVSVAAVLRYTIEVCISGKVIAFDPGHSDAILTLGFDKHHFTPMYDTKQRTQAWNASANRVPELWGGMRPSQSPEVAAEMEYQQREQAIERYRTWMRDLDTEYASVIHDLEDLAEDIALAADDAAHTQAQEACRRRMSILMDYLQEFEPTLLRLSELSHATYFPWGYYVRIVYEQRMEQVAMTTLHVARALTLNARMAKDELRTSSAIMGFIERMVTLNTQDLKTAHQAIRDIAGFGLAAHLEPPALPDLPPVPTRAPHLQGGMMQYEQDPNMPVRDSTLEALVEAESRFFDQIHAILDDFRKLLLRIYCILDNLEITIILYDRARFYKIPHIRSSQTCMGLLKEQARMMRRMSTSLLCVPIPWGAYVAQCYREAFQEISQQLECLAASIDTKTSDVLLRLEEDKLDLGAQMEQFMDLEDRVRAIRAVLFEIYSAQIEQPERMQTRVRTLPSTDSMALHGGMHSCSSTDTFATGDQEGPTNFMDCHLTYPVPEIFIPPELREGRLVAVTPYGSRSLVWHAQDEVAWMLLSSGFHPWSHVLTGILPGWEVCLGWIG